MISVIGGVPTANEMSFNLHISKVQNVSVSEKRIMESDERERNQQRDYLVEAEYTINVII